MKRAPTLKAIDAVETRLAESRRETREGLHRLQAAMRAKIPKPSTLAALAGAAGLVGLWLAQRPRPRRRYAPAKVGVGIALSAYAATAARALLTRYGMQGLELAVRKAREALHSRAERQRMAQGNVNVS